MTWKKRCVSLIVCFALIVSITVVRPPKAEAIAFEAGIAVPIILAVAIASGITFLSEGMTESGLTEYIGQQLQSYATDIGTTVSEWWQGIGSIARRDDGKVVITSPAYQGIQNFLSWWKSGNNVSAEPQVFYSVTSLGFPCPMAGSLSEAAQLLSAGNGLPVVRSDILPDSTFPYGFYYYPTTERVYVVCRNGVFLSSKSNDIYANTSFALFPEAGRYTIVCMYGSTKTVIFTTSVLDSIFLGDSASLSVSQPASYDSLELQDNESVALDLGATVEAGATLEDILAEYLAKIVDNTATAAQEVTTESGEGEGEGDDDDTAPYLPFIPRIWEKLQGLPDDIADKVHDLFVPSAAFVEALPAEFADVFDSRCGLLTYPAALLADFLTRLATLTAQDPILRWGNIKEPFSDRQLIAAGSYNLNSAIQTEAMQTVYNVYMICVKAAVAFWFVELCKRKYEKIIRS